MVDRRPLLTGQKVPIQAMYMELAFIYVALESGFAEPKQDLSDVFLMLLRLAVDEDVIKMCLTEILQILEGRREAG